MHAFLVVGLIVGGLWLFRRVSIGPQAGNAQALPAPDPIPSGPGQSLVSPAMSGGSPMMQSQNDLRLNTNMVDVISSTRLMVSKSIANPILPSLPTAANGITNLPSSSAPLGTVATTVFGNVFPWRKV